jgi:hypothetical protein
MSSSSVGWNRKPAGREGILLLAMATDENGQKRAGNCLISKAMYALKFLRCRALALHL